MYEVIFWLLAFNIAVSCTIALAGFVMVAANGGER